MVELNTGWLSPTGDLIKCEYFDHMAVAQKLVEDLGYAGLVNRADDILLSHGWVRISMSLLHKREWSIHWEKFLSEPQKAVLRPYYEESEIPVGSTGMIKWSKEMDQC